VTAVIPKTVYPTLPKRIPHTLGFKQWCIYFNGVDQCVRIADAVSLQVTDNFSIEWMMKSTDTARIVDFYNFRFVTNGSGSLRLATLGSKFPRWAPSGVTPNDGGWHHGVVTFRRPNYVAYYDGEVSITKSFDDVLVSSAGYNKVLMARYDEATDTFCEGYLAYFRFYKDKVLTQEEVCHNMLNYHNPVTEGLTLWLEMKEGRGSVVYDKSGYGNDGALINDSPWVRVKKWELRSEVGL